MDDGALLGGEVFQGGAQCVTEYGFTWLERWRKQIDRVRAELVVRFVLCPPAADHVDGQIVGQAQKKSPGVADPVQLAWALSQFEKQLLQQIVGIGLAARKIQQEA